MGHAGSSGLGFEAFVWDPTNGMREIDEVLEALGLAGDLTGWSLNRALAVSGDGLTIVGYGTNPSGSPEGWIAVIPEPSSALLFVSGLALLACKRNSKRCCRGHGQLPNHDRVLRTDSASMATRSTATSSIRWTGGRARVPRNRCGGVLLHSISSRPAAERVIVVRPT
jgi:hypothetical protein